MKENDTEKQCCSEEKWVKGVITTSVGDVVQVSTTLSFNDTLGTWKARLGINRMNYKINPGLYAVGEPCAASPVLVTANYKLTFDVLREKLTALNAWILVLDTDGINVWCAAGKGTFGTTELLNSIRSTSLHKIIDHRTLILPQLGAPGVSAHEITKHSGFKVIYGPVKADDIKDFLQSGMEATRKMRTVTFKLFDRLVLIPMELTGTFKVSMMIFGTLFLLNLVDTIPFGAADFYAYIGALFTGCIITTALLPWIPGRAFAWKGWLLGFLWAVTFNFLHGWPTTPSYSLTRALAYLLILPSISSYYAMNFTGSSTYTSLSGVLKEMRIAVPIITITITIGSILLLLNSFIKL